MNRQLDRRNHTIKNIEDITPRDGKMYPPALVQVFCNINFGFSIEHFPWSPTQSFICFAIFFPVSYTP